MSIPHLHHYCWHTGTGTQGCAHTSWRNDIQFYITKLTFLDITTLISCSHLKVSHIIQKTKYAWNTLICTGITNRLIREAAKYQANKVKRANTDMSCEPDLCSNHFLTIPILQLTDLRKPLRRYEMQLENTVSLWSCKMMDVFSYFLVHSGKQGSNFDKCFLEHHIRMKEWETKYQTWGFSA